MYTVIGYPITRTFRVMWFLEEAKQEYTLNPARPRSELVKQHSDLGKVPVLVTEGQAITDSTAIITYLADKHSILTFPAGSLNRARQDGLTQFMLDEFDAALWTAARHTFALPEEHRVPAVKDSIRWEIEQSAKSLAARIGHGPFLMGETMTIADIVATHCLTWAKKAKIDVQNKVLHDYADRMFQRPAYQAAVAKGKSALNSAEG